MAEYVTLEEYAEILRENDPKMSPQEAIDTAQDIFIKRGQAGEPPLTRFDIEFPDEQLPGMEEPWEVDNEENVDPIIFREEYDEEADH